jgi:hypothetical protein
MNKIEDYSDIICKKFTNPMNEALVSRVSIKAQSLISFYTSKPTMNQIWSQLFFTVKQNVKL